GSADFAGNGRTNFRALEVDFGRGKSRFGGEQIRLRLRSAGAHQVSFLRRNRILFLQGRSTLGFSKRDGGPSFGSGDIGASCFQGGGIRTRIYREQNLSRFHAFARSETHFNDSSGNLRPELYGLDGRDTAD